jgi:hypothetical protein
LRQGELPQQWSPWEFVAAATGLTKLELELDTGNDRSPECLARLAVLTCLQDLAVCGIQLTYNTIGHHIGHGAASALTVLSSLTRLSLSNVDTVAATALARELKQLQHLDTCYRQGELRGLYLDGFQGRLCFRAIARLTQLTYLNLSHSRGLTRQGLMQLTRLSRLQELDVHRWLRQSSDEVTPEVVKDFWARVRGQQQQQQQHDKRGRFLIGMPV